LGEYKKEHRYSRWRDGSIDEIAAAAAAAVVVADRADPGKEKSWVLY
jgi:hypothetical protein